ncbi:GGDEF domain-containing protein [Marinobacter halodurans]|uniref:diguanylate cyclase n=1 Tax=Marinobacter halodurans TaxID=2528979 RepID=A0ABY1ZTW3_9GAMM|nr:GGDEF domain-containing protein [Marinobacter halodurans]TBW59034.1 GGDEF domain-containing protein [Marinobacter halodurans]
MPSNPTSLTSPGPERAQALADLERLSLQWQRDDDIFTRLCRRMTTTLDLQELMAIFAEELASVVPFDRLSYQHTVEDQPVDIQIGQGGNHRCEYGLNLGGEHFGVLTLYRRLRFAKQEQTVIEQMLGTAINSIRNACRYDAMWRASLTDVVTGIPNKRAFEDALEREVSLGNRHGDLCGLILCDLDRFKSVNDRYGHMTGDRILRATALAIQGATRSTDTVYRIGGEEFGIILPHIGDRECILVADRIRNAITQIRLDSDSGPVSVTASAGFGIQARGESAAAWFKRADEALYRAKADGRDCTRQAEPAQNTDIAFIDARRRNDCPHIAHGSGAQELRTTYALFRPTACGDSSVCGPDASPPFLQPA